MDKDWAPPALDESLKAAYAARTRKPKRGILSGVETGLFETKRAPGPHDWLNGPGVKDRGGQTFAQWNMENRRRPQRGDVIRLVPLGDFDPEELDVEWLCQCVRSFFTGMEVEVLPALSSRDLLRQVTHRENDFGTQLLTQDIHKYLDTLHGRRKGSNAFATMAFSLYDLYPRPEWNFVFGQAKPFNGTGVFSFARYRDHDRRQFHMRCAKVLCHELGHLFGLSHCIWFQCLMNGSNGDWESDQNPAHVCPVCLAKLDVSLGGVDLLARERSLVDFWQGSGFQAEAEWCQSRQEAIEQSLSKAANASEKNGIVETSSITAGRINGGHGLSSRNSTSSSRRTPQRARARTPPSGPPSSAPQKPSGYRTLPRISPQTS